MELLIFVKRIKMVYVVFHQRGAIDELKLCSWYRAYTYTTILYRLYLRSWKIIGTSFLLIYAQIVKINCATLCSPTTVIYGIRPSLFPSLEVVLIYIVFAASDGVLVLERES